MWVSKSSMVVGMSYLWRTSAVVVVILFFCALLLRDKDPQRDMRFFFQMAITDDTFGYTLLGDKPVSQYYFSNKPKSFSLSEWISYFAPYNKRITKGWSHFSKNCGFVEFDHFIFFSELSSNEKITIVSLVNKRVFGQIIDRYRSDFEKVLGLGVTGDALINMAKTKPFFSEVLKNHQALIGISLGFGRSNAWMFYYKQTRDLATDQDLYDKYIRHKTRHFLRYLCAIDVDQIDEVSPVVYMGDPKSEETLALNQSYAGTKERIIQRYRGCDLLDTTWDILHPYFKK